MQVTIITDASFCHKTKASGYGVWIASDIGRKAFEGPLNFPNNNNVAEAMAISNALWHGIKENLIKRNASILIQTDSDTAIRLFKLGAFPSCKRARPQYQQALQCLQDYVTRFNLTLHFKHVKGHSGHNDNRTLAQVKCDTAAKRQMIIQRDVIIRNNPLISMEAPKKKQTSNYMRSRKGRTNG